VSCSIVYTILTLTVASVDGQVDDHTRSLLGRYLRLAVAARRQQALDEAAVSYIADGTGRLEVIDVRLAPGPDGGEDNGWLAYGTLRTTGLSPLIPKDEPMPRACAAPPCWLVFLAEVAGKATAASAAEHGRHWRVHDVLRVRCRYPAAHHRRSCSYRYWTSCSMMR